jgi:hypothetical protein
MKKAPLTTLARISRSLLLRGRKFLTGSGLSLQAQPKPRVWFGTLKVDGKITQARFEVYSETYSNNGRKTILYAPYGLMPVPLENVQEGDKHLRFWFPYNQLPYTCRLQKQEQERLEYTGTGTCPDCPSLEITIRAFTEEDAVLQGKRLEASPTDVAIIERAQMLLNKGNNWNPLDNRICDTSDYPYRWSLFCALHQASIDVDGEYRHLRPALEAVREAIKEATKGKKYAHILRDFNNEAESFEPIARVLDRGKEMIAAKLAGK